MGIGFQSISFQEIVVCPLLFFYPPSAFTITILRSKNQRKQCSDNKVYCRYPEIVVRRLLTRPIDLRGLIVM